MKFEFEHKNNRRGFVRQIAKTAAVGLGIALYPAARASATSQAPVRCCTGTQCLGVSCPPGDARLFCSALGCCVCEAGQLDENGCKSYPNPPC